MIRKFYQVTLNGKDIPGCRWATRDAARFCLKTEAEATLDELRKAEDPDDIGINRYEVAYDYEYDWADLIHRNVPEYGEPETKTKTHVYGIREGDEGEEERARWELTEDMYYASR